jgi:hypothetical protein
MSKVKLAIIRGENSRNCPFGLPIIDACKCAGSSIKRMAPLLEQNTKEENEKLASANKLVYAYQKEDKPCAYADKILEHNNKVDCDYGDNGQGLHSTDFRASPLYPQTFHGLMLDGLYGFPLGFYADNQESRNLFLGLYSLLGHSTKEEIIKLADNYDKSGETGKAKILDELLEKLSKENNKEIFDKIENYLIEYRDRCKKQGINPLLMEELSKKYIDMGKFR